MVLGVCIVLAGIVWLVFGQTLHHQFVNFDDEENVYGNPVVSRGLSLHNVGWAFTHTRVVRWVPISTLVHMLNCQLFGLWPGGHHLTSFFLHGTAALLLFLVLRQLTAKLWRSAFVAALFALHPLGVEAVAWVSALQYVVSGLFFMLTLWAYERYARAAEDESGRQESRKKILAGGGFMKSCCLFLASCFPASKTARRWYLAVLFFFALGLLSKEMLVTLPCLLLLLDYWPLNRMSLGKAAKGKAQHHPFTFGCLVVEKIPLLALSLAFCVITLLVARNIVKPLETYSLPVRVGNALGAYGSYLEQIVYPAGLAAWYPHPGAGLFVEKVICSLIAVISISMWAFVMRQRWPYLLVGWLWYLGMLVPMIGLFEKGAQERSDRYTYLAQIGIYIMIAWTAVDLSGRWRYRRWILGAISGCVIAILIGCARRQTSYWRNSEALWEHTLAVTSGNYFAQSNLGTALLQAGRWDEAAAPFQRALEIKPGYADAHISLGYLMLRQGRTDEAIAHFREALRIKPASAEAHYDLGNAMLRQERAEEAIVQFREALRIDPANAEAHINLGSVLLREGRIEEAIFQFREVLQSNPANAEALVDLGNAVLQLGHGEEAIAQYREALRIKPGSAEAHYNLGHATLQQGAMEEAVAQFREALRINSAYLEVYNELGSTLFRQGRIEEAIAQYRAAIRINPTYAAAHNNLGNVLHYQGLTEEAIAQYHAAIQSNPVDTDARKNLGNALFQQGRTDEALKEMEKALDLQPAKVDLQNDLAWMLATAPQGTLRDGAKAVQLATQANQSTSLNDPHILRTMAAALAETRQFPEAVQIATKALQLFEAKNDTSLTDSLRGELKLYEAGRPLQDGQ